MITVTPHWDYPWAIKSDRELTDQEFDELAEWWHENVESGYLVTKTTRSWFLGYPDGCRRWRIVDRLGLGPRHPSRSRAIRPERGRQRIDHSAFDLMDRLVR